MAARVRVGFLSGSKVIGGTERYLRELANGIDPRSFDSVFLCHRAIAPFFMPGERRPAHFELRAWEPGSQPGDHEMNGRDGLMVLAEHITGDRLRTLVAPLVKQLAMKVDQQLVKRRLEAAELDLLHVHNGGHPGSPVALGAVLAAVDLGLPCILSVHGIAKPRGPLPRLEGVADRAVASSVRKVVVVGDGPGQMLIRDRGFDPSKLVVVTTGIRAPDPRPTKEMVDARRRLGLENGQPVVGSVASFQPVKGHDILLSALSMVRDRIPELGVVLAGIGPTRRAAVDQAASLGLEDVVRFPGEVKPFDTLPAFDAFVSASRSEGMPLSILEAMSQAVPVVATRVGAVGDAVVDGKTGFLVAPDDVEGLAGCVIDLLSDPSLSRRLGEAGRCRFLDRHRFDQFVATFEAMYDSVLGQDQ